MAFNFFKWLLRARDAPEAVTVEDMFDLFTDCYIRELAFQSCVNLTANAVEPQPQPEPRSCNGPIEGPCTIKFCTAPRWGRCRIVPAPPSGTSW